MSDRGAHFSIRSATCPRPLRTRLARAGPLSSSASLPSGGGMKEGPGRAGVSRVAVQKACRSQHEGEAGCRVSGTRGPCLGEAGAGRQVAPRPSRHLPRVSGGARAQTSGQDRTTVGSVWGPWPWLRRGFWLRVRCRARLFPTELQRPPSLLLSGSYGSAEASFPGLEFNTSRAEPAAGVGA